MGTTLVLPGGGSRTMYLSGVMIGAELRPEQISQIFALSSAAPVAAYFVAGQIDKAGVPWIDDIATSNFLDWSRLLRFQYPGNVRELIGNGCRSLDAQAIPRGKVFISTVRVRDGQTVYHELTPDNAHEILQATCSIPVLTSPYLLDGQAHVDGGLEETFPVLAAYQSGSRKILAISNRPESYRIKPYSPLACWCLFPNSPDARQALARRAARFDKTWDFLQHPPADTEVLLIQPERRLPAERMTTDTNLVRRTFDLGVEMGREQKQRIQDFVSN